MKLETLVEVNARITALEAAHKGTISLKAALTKLGRTEDATTLDTLMLSLGSEIQGLTKEVKQRKDAQKPYLSAYVARTLHEIPSEIRQAQQRIKSGCTEIEAKRKRMRDAGVPEVELLRIAPDYDTAADEAMITSLDAETAQWERFNATGLDADLPAGADEHLQRHPQRLAA